MNQSVIMKLGAVVSVLFGVAFLFAPNTVMALYKSEPLNTSGLYNAMLYGGFLIGLAAMNWSASTASAMEARHVILGTLVSVAIGFVVALYKQLTDPAVPVMSWLNVAIFLVFTVLYGYLQFARTPARSPTAGSAA